MVLTHSQEDDILVHILSVGLGQPADGSGMIERVLKHNGAYCLEDISMLTDSLIQGFFRLDTNDQETNVLLNLGDRLKLKRMQGFFQITIWENKDTIPDYADWMQVTRDDLAAFAVNPRVPPTRA